MPRRRRPRTRQPPPAIREHRRSSLWPRRRRESQPPPAIRERRRTIQLVAAAPPRPASLPRLERRWSSTSRTNSASSRPTISQAVVMILLQGGTNADATPNQKLERGLVQCARRLCGSVLWIFCGDVSQPAPTVARACSVTQRATNECSVARNGSMRRVWRRYRAARRHALSGTKKHRPSRTNRKQRSLRRSLEKPQPSPSIRTASARAPSTRPSSCRPRCTTTSRRPCCSACSRACGPRACGGPRQCSGT